MTSSATNGANGANHDADNMENRLLSALKQNPYITQTDLAKEYRYQGELSRES